MSYFQERTSQNPGVAGSYGDSVGRAEFSKRHVLDLQYLKPLNFMNLLRPDVIPHAYNALAGDLKVLHERTPDQPRTCFANMKCRAIICVE